jgi:hypothetical protein
MRGRGLLLLLLATAAAAAPGPLAAASGATGATGTTGGPGILAIAPMGGILGSQPFFALRAGYTIAGPVTVEAELGHNLGDAAGAYLHSAGVLVHPPSWQRARLFATAGFGTFSASPSEALAATAVTRSHFRIGGGIEYAVRDDFGLRLDVRHHRILLGETGTGNDASLGATEVSAGLSFARRIWSPPAPSKTP